MSRVTDPARSLVARFPAVAAEWDFEAEVNRGASPETVMGVAGRLSGWVCRVCEHRWVDRVANRTKNGNGCAECNRRTSSQEAGLRDFLSERLPLEVKSSVPRRDGVRRRAWLVDVLCISHNLVVEFDGSYWHSEAANPGKTESDRLKAEDIRGQGFRVVRVREEPLGALHADDVVVPVGLSGVELGDQVWVHLVGLGVVPGEEAPAA